MAIILCGALLLGLIIAVIEFGFVHGDEPGGIGIHHALGTFIPTIAMTFISMNAGIALSMLKMSENTMTDILVRAGIAVIAVIWINAKAAIGRGVGEKLPHSLAIAALIAASFYIWTYALKAAVGGILPC